MAGVAACEFLDSVEAVADCVRMEVQGWCGPGRVEVPPTAAASAAPARASE